MTIPYYEQKNPIEPAPSMNVGSALLQRMGRGLSVPVELVSTAGWNTAGGVEKIRQSIYMALLTPVGRRFLQPDFGSLITMMIHEAWTSKLQRELVRETKKALETWVPTIILGDVSVTLDPNYNNIVLIELNYVVKGTEYLEELELRLSRDDSMIHKPGYFTIQGKSIFGKEIA